MFVPELDQRARTLVAKGHSMNTDRTYSSAQRRYIQFCDIHGLVTCPASEQTLLWFVTHLHYTGVPLARSIRVYLAAVRSLHIRTGFSEPPHLSPRIMLALRGIERGNPPPRQKSPITYDILLQMYPFVTNIFNDIMLWSAMTFAFFGSLRGDEFTTHAVTDGHSQTLCLQHVLWSSHKGTPYIRVSIPHTKTELHGITVYIGCAKSVVCGYCALRKYLQHRNITGIAKASSALFVYANGQVLDHPSFNSYVQSMVARLGLDPQCYTAHSLRAGAASTAAAKGFQEYEIKMLGNWKSSVYTTYIRDIKLQTIHFASRLSKS